MSGSRSEARPFAPGTYPVVVVGSGPGALQTSYCLRRLGVDHAVISRDERPGGMFQRFPIYERLLSWTEPDAVPHRGTREYEWYDQNSLVADDPSHRACVAEIMVREERQLIVPRRDQMERGLAAFAERGGVAVRYGCAWEGTRREGDGFVLSTSDGEYRCRYAVFALGVTEPWKSAIPGVEHVPHYADLPRDRASYAGKDVVVIGKRNSAFEVADGLEPWARRIWLISPRPVDTSVIALSSVRARYMQPLEHHQIGGSTLAVDAAVERIERADGRYVVHAQGTTRPGQFKIEADAAIAATGFSTPLRDLVDLGAATVAQGRIPALTPFWESVTVPGIFFAGNASQGAAGLRKHGVASSSAAVQGFRYNARVLARRLATLLGLSVPRDNIPGSDLVDAVLKALTSSPELWAQKAYLAQVFGLDGETEVVPLAHFVDSGGPDALAASIEMNEKGDVYPVVYVRRGGEVSERTLEPDPLRNYEQASYRKELRELL